MTAGKPPASNQGHSHEAWLLLVDALFGRLTAADKHICTSTSWSKEDTQRHAVGADRELRGTEV